MRQTTDVAITSNYNSDNLALRSHCDSHCPSCSSCVWQVSTSWFPGWASRWHWAPGWARLGPRQRRCGPGRRHSRRSPWDWACGHTLTRCRPQDRTAPLGHIERSAESAKAIKHTMHNCTHRTSKAATADWRHLYLLEKCIGSIDLSQMFSHGQDLSFQEAKHRQWYECGSYFKKWSDKRRLFPNVFAVWGPKKKPTGKQKRFVGITPMQNSHGLK